METTAIHEARHRAFKSFENFDLTGFEAKPSKIYSYDLYRNARLDEVRSCKLAI